MLKKIKRKHVVTATRVVCQFAAASVVTSITKRSMPIPVTLLQQASVNIGSYSLGAVAGHHAGVHMAREMDSLITTLGKTIKDIDAPK